MSAEPLSPQSSVLVTQSCPGLEESKAQKLVSASGEYASSTLVQPLRVNRKAIEP